MLPGAKADIHIKDWNVVLNLAARGDIGFGEDFIDQNWTTTNISHLIQFTLQNIRVLEQHMHGNKLSKGFFYLINNLIRANRQSRSKIFLNITMTLVTTFISWYLTPQ